MEKAKAVTEKLMASYHATDLKGDLSAFYLQHYTKDCRYMPPGASTTVGRDSEYARVLTQYSHSTHTVQIIQ